jgi:hypothetical protein
LWGSGDCACKYRAHWWWRQFEKKCVTDRKGVTKSFECGRLFAPMTWRTKAMARIMKVMAKIMNVTTCIRAL